MAKKLRAGSTPFEDLADILDVEYDWLESRRARLFPHGNTTQENQTTAIFLATLAAVKEYRELLIGGLGISKITNRNSSLHVYTEICNDAKSERPDGLIVLTSGKRNPVIEWAAFVEVKVGANQLDSYQIERYIDFAREVGVETIISISNAITSDVAITPFSIGKRRFDLKHWSWSFLKVMSTRLLNTNAVDDEDHVYILQEFRRFLDGHPNVRNVVSMGTQWKDAIQSIHEGDKLDPVAVNAVATSYAQEEMDIGLQLTDNTPYFVQLMLRNGENRYETLNTQLHDSRKLFSTFTIDGERKHSFDIEVDPTRKSISCSCRVFIEKGKAVSQTTQLLKMLENSGIQSEICIRGLYHRNKNNGTHLLTTLEAERAKSASYSIINKEFGEEFKEFELFVRREIGRNMTGNQNFVSEIEGLAQAFLLQVVRYAILGEK